MAETGRGVQAHPIIAQTGWGQDRDKARASEAGFDHHLVKPVAPDDLERLLAEVTAG
jgi:CheY-like chemotaxis protein